MASFFAELRVAGHVFPVLHCHYGVHQATHQRGQVSTKVRKEPVHVTLSVPDGDVLPAWAADPHKRQQAALVFKSAAGGSALETLLLKAAYCVSYREEFRAGDVGNGGYVCHVVLSDPDGFTIQAGGPVGAFVAPAAREHGVPGVAVGAQQNGMLSDCTEAERLKLQRQVEQHCKSTKQKCLETDSCSVLENKMEAVNGCIAARTKINMKCFKGGNEGHKVAIEIRINALLKCQAIYARQCGKNPQPAPNPQVVPTTNSEPGNDSSKKYGPTGLVGAALIVFFILTAPFRMVPN